MKCVAWRYLDNINVNTCDPCNLYFFKLVAISADKLREHACNWSILFIIDN